MAMTQPPTTAKSHPQTLSAGVTYVPISAGPLPLSNVFLVDAGAGEWVLIDTGVMGFASRIIQAAQARYGDVAPRAIILTHAHFDHIGNIHSLLERWPVPVYAHPLELPYLSGQSKLPPLDPTVGGFMATLAHFFPSSGTDISNHVRPLPLDSTVPDLAGWRWMHTPGHTPGHISLWHEGEQLLIAGDAVATMDQETASKALRETPEINGPPSYATCDWEAARSSVELLADLAPRTIVSGHGAPLTGDSVAGALRALADHFVSRALPKHGRYVPYPARPGPQGIISLPPPVPDPFWRIVATASLGGAFVLASGIAWSRSHASVVTANSAIGENDIIR